MLAGTTRTQWCAAAIAIGTKSLTGSYSSALNANTLFNPEASKVWPSGAALANSFAPVAPPPPGRFSTMTGTPNRADRPGVTDRTVTSITPPDGSGQMTLMGLVG